MENDIKETVKVGAEGCCCTSSGSWCKFFYTRRTESHTNTAATTPTTHAPSVTPTAGKK